VWSAGYGLPDVYHPDEPRIVERAVRFHAGDLNPRFFNWPSLYMYILAGVYGLALGGDEGVVAAFARAPAPFYLLGRLVTGLAGAATIVALGALGRRAGTPRAGILAAAFLTVDLLHVRDSHFVTTDVPMTGLVVGAALLALRYWQEGRPRDAGLAGLAGGLAASMKYPGGLVLLALVLAHAGRMRLATAPAWRWIAAPPLVLAAGLALVGFLLGTPYALVTPRAFVTGVLDELREIGTVQFGNEADLPGYAFHLAHALPVAMGWPLCVLALAGVIRAVRHGGLTVAIVLAFPLPYFFVIGSWSSRFERYAIPLLPFLALAAAAACLALAARCRRGRWRTVRLRPRLALVGLVTLLLGYAGARVVTLHRLLAQPDTRVLAAHWIERTVRPGARIALEPYSPALPVSAAMLREEGAALARDLARPLPPDVQRPAPPAAPVDGGYRVSRLNVYDLERLRAERVEYVVLSSFVFGRHQRACDRHPIPCAFYRALDRHGELVHAVTPGIDDDAPRVGDLYSPLTRLGARRHPGPAIRIYHLREAAGA
jgi:4-amino-4-deoxy-L-arabinose transferase-like glycosyltransferase